MMQTLWTRDYTLHRMETVMRSLRSTMTRRWLGFIVEPVEVTGLRNGLASFQVESGSWKRYLRVVDGLFMRPARFRTYLAEYTSARNAFVRTAKRIGGRAAAINDPATLAELLTEFLDVHDRFMLIGQWTPFYLGECAESMLPPLLRRTLKSEARAAEAFSVILSLERMTAMRREHHDLLRIALAPVGQRTRRITEHTQKYQWLPCINVIISKPWTAAHFSRQLRAVLRPGNARFELQRLLATFALARQRYRRLLAELPVPVRTSARQAHAIAFIKDDRDDARRQAYFAIRPLYRALARSLGLPPSQIEWLTPDEILDGLRGQRVPLKDIRWRQRGYMLKVRNGRVRVFPSRSASTALSKSEVSTVRGIAAGAGKAIGRARIVRLVADLPAVKNGDILIAVFTHPDYLSAMRRAGAIVTDEGGLTSHAAIVARELKKPCVVGTKVATQVFKDGDRVEVDATKGTVRKLS